MDDGADELACEPLHRRRPRVPEGAGERLVADGADHLSPAGLQVLNLVDGDAWVAWNAGIGVMMLGAAGSLLSRHVASGWLGWSALVLGVLLFVPFADFFALLASALWIVATSLLLFRQAAGAAYAPTPGVA